MSRFPVAFAVLCAATLAAGCDSATPPLVECPGAADCVDPGPDTAAGVNLTALFAAPTPAERDSVAARLARTGGTDAPRISGATATPLAPDADGTRYTRLSFTDAAGRTVTSAVVRTPFAGVSPSGLLPVLLILTDGSGDASEADFLTGETARGLDRNVIQVVVAARGAALTARTAGSTAQTPYPSAVAADPYRADVLDLLAVADNLALVPRADAARVGAVGVGRGGAVALLAAERRGSGAASRFRAVASLGAPTSLFDLSFQTAARSALLGRAVPPLPAAEALLAPVRALAAGQISPAEARLRLLELSAVAAANRLPATFAFHATPDDIVPPAHLARLQEQGDGPTTAPRRFETVVDGRHETLLDATDVRGRLADFFDLFL